jgi:large subunit ribosomal protein L20
MPRVKRGTVVRRRHRAVIKDAKGYWGARSRLYRTAHEAVMRAMRYAYHDRRLRKRDFRRLWITRISAATRERGLPYGRFTEGLRKAGVEVNRKMLADLAINDPEAFTELTDLARHQLAA